MPGEREPINGWTVHTLKEYIEAILLEKERRLDQRTDEQDRAINIATQALDARLGLLNEFRAQQAEEAKKYLPRDEYSAAHASLSDKIDAQGRQLYILVGLASAALLVLHFIGVKLP